MKGVLISVLAMLRGVVATRAELHLEVLVLRHQLLVCCRGLGRGDLVSRRGPVAMGLAVTQVWTGWRTALVLLKPVRCARPCDGSGRQLPVPEDPLGARNYFSADRVGPEAPRGRRLGPDGENRAAASIFGSTSTPTKQFCISSQF